MFQSSLVVLGVALCAFRTGITSPIRGSGVYRCEPEGRPQHDQGDDLVCLQMRAKTASGRVRKTLTTILLTSILSSVDSLLLREHLKLEERHWWFVARRRILLGVLERNLDLKGGLQILDAGCGGGATMESLCRYGSVRGIDISEEAVEYNRGRGREVILGSIERMPFADNSFDLALALDVIEHVPDDLQALRELFRILRPGELLLVTVPALQMLWSAHDVSNVHYRRYTLGELRGRVETAGFEVVTATYFNSILFPLILVFRWLQRLRPRSTASDLTEVPQPLNTLLTGVFSLEKPFVGRIKLPFGVSALCFARKP